MSTPTRDQAKAARPDASVWVQANAGSGKTRVLVDRVARLLLEGVSPQSILCLTYTKAAASEMQSRLFQRLGRWCIAKDQDLRQELGALGVELAETDMGQARALFAQALETPGGLRIQTIHAFCAKLLRRFPLEAGIAPGFLELDDSVMARLQAGIVQGLGAYMEDETLSQAIKASVEMAGSEQSLHDRVQDLSRESARIRAFVTEHGGLDAAGTVLRQKLGLSEPDTSKLYDEAMGKALPRTPIKALLPELDAGKPTDKKMAETLRIALSEAPAQQRWNAYKSLAFTASNQARTSNPYTKAVSDALPQIADLFQLKPTPQGQEILRILQTEQSLRLCLCYQRCEALIRLNQHVSQSLKTGKRQLGGLDFDDLIQISLSLLTRTEVRDWVKWKLDAGISDILIDEAQDTSAEQWALLRALSEEFFSGSANERLRPRTLFAVGDDKQSIYGFQGADPALFRSEQERINRTTSQAKLAFHNVALETSFRSTPPILEFVDAVFAQLPPEGMISPIGSDSPPELANIPRHTAHRKHAPGCVELWIPDEPTSPQDDDVFTAQHDYQSSPSPKAELAEQIAQWLKDALACGTSIHDPETGIPRPLRLSDVLILLRGRKSGLFDALLFALQREGLAVAGADRLKPLEAAPVQDILNLIRFALRPEDDLVLAELMTSPFCGLDIEADLFDLAHNRQKESLWSRLGASSNPKHKAAYDFLAIVLDHAHDPPFAFLSSLLERPGPSGQTGYECLLSRFGSPAMLAIDALVNLSLEATGQAANALQAFLAWVETDKSEIKRDGAKIRDEIRIMTIHGAKGGEAPFVILPDMNFRPDKIDSMQFSPDGVPVWLGRQDTDSPFEARIREHAKARALAESRRLLYVALTRARDRLLICRPWTRNTVKNSCFEFCLSGMQALVESGKAEKISSNAFRLGQPPQAYKAKPQSQPESGADSSLNLPDWIGQAPRAQPPTPQLLTPSSSQAQAEGLQWGKRVQSGAQARGVCIHALLEHLPDIATEKRHDIAKALMRRWPQFDADTQDQIIASVLRLLAAPEFASLFGPDSRAEVPIAGHIQDTDGQARILHGQVDRLIITPQSIQILDFKTSANIPESPEQTPAHILYQMACYRRVLEASFSDRPVHCLILWTAEPKLMRLPDPLTRL